MPTTTQRGYGASHQRERARWQRLIDRGALVSCWRCGCRITPTTPWHLGHDDWNRSVTRGPECAGCNLSAAGKKTALLKRARKNRRRW